MIMTKDQEIAAWKSFAASMPPAVSYSGKWIAEQISFIDADIKADMEPGTMHAVSMRDCREQLTQARADADTIRSQAQYSAGEIIKRAEAEAAEIIRKARAHDELIRHRAAAAIRQALQTIEG